MTKQGETSIWKKEITFRRKPKPEPEPAVEPARPKPQPAAEKPAAAARSEAPPEPVALPPVTPPTAAGAAAAAADPTAGPASPSVAVPPVSASAREAEEVAGEVAAADPVPRVSASVPVPTAAAAAAEPTAVPGSPPVAVPPVSASAREAEEVAGEVAAADPVPPVSASVPVPTAAAAAAEPTAVPGSPPVAVPPVSASAREAEEVAGEVAAADPVPPVFASAPAPGGAAVAASARPEPEPEPTLVPSQLEEPLSEAEPVPVPPPAESPNLSRQERREAKKAADQLAKKQRQRAKELAKEERKSSRHKHKRVVGLKIGASQIAAAHVVNNGGPRLLGMARASLPLGVVVGGELREPEQLSAALKTLFRKNKLPQTCVRLGIANNRIGVRTLEISGIEDDSQLANAIRFRAQEVLPIPLDEAVLDYRILDDRVGDDGARVCRVLLVVAHRELVERYVAACKKAGLKLIGIDLEAFALLRALADPANPPADDASVVCIAIGHDRSTLAVSNGRVCEFTRVLSWGGSDLDVALARTLDLTPAAAEPLKQGLALGEGGEAAGLDAPEADAARAAMLNELRSFARELVGSLRYYQEQPNSLGIAEILITGGASAAPGLAAELERLIGIPVRVAEPMARVRVPRKLRNQNGSAGSLAVAVGLGIED